MKMKYAPFMVALVASLSTFAAMAQEAPKKLNVPPGQQLNAALDTARADAKVSAEKEYSITGVTFEYAPYKERLESYFDDLKKQRQKAGDESDRWERKAKDNQAKLDAIQDKIKSTERKLRLAEMSKGTKTDTAALQKELTALHAQRKEKMPYVDFFYQQSTDALDAWIVVDDLEKEIHKKTKLAEDKKLYRRPILNKVKLSNNQTLHLQAHLELDLEVYRLLEEIYLEQDQKASDFSKEALELWRSYEGLTKSRSDLVDLATMHNQKLQDLNKTLDFTIEVEVQGRAIFQTATDVAEVVIEGKTPPGMLREALAKLVETTFVTGFGNSFQMYDPKELMKEFSTEWVDRTSHSPLAGIYNEKNAKTALNELAKLVISGSKEIGIRDAERRTALNQMKGALSRSAIEMTKRAGDETLYMGRNVGLLETLIKQDLDVTQRIAAQSFAGKGVSAALQAQKASLQQEVATTLFEMAQSRKAVVAIQKAVQEGKEKMAATTLRGFVEESDQVLSKSSGGKSLRGLGRGLAWNGLRGMGHTVFDKISENAWYNYLDHWYIAQGTLDQLKYTSLVWLKLKKTFDEAAEQAALHRTMRDAQKAIMAEYYSERLSSDGLHILVNQPVEQDNGRIVVDIETKGSLLGEVVTLRGNLKSTKLLSHAGKSVLPKGNVDAARMEISPMVTMQRSYALPGFVKLSDLSSDGKLELAIEVR